MNRLSSLALAVLLPVAASAQLGAVEAAREAGRKSDAGNARIEGAADAALQAGQERAGAPGAARLALPGSEGGAAALDQGRGAVPPPDTYTIRPGDTLWDLSGRFLNNPWYWPKVWSFNPEIANPHWIEPGNLLKFYPSAEEAPARVEPVSAGEKPVEVAAEEEEAPPPAELEDFSRADLSAPQPVEEQEEVTVSGPNRIGYVPPRTVSLRRSAFVTPQEVESSGSLVAAFEEKLLLSISDKAYARFKRPSDAVPGQSYIVYRTERKIHHPVTKELLGYQTTILGTAKAVKVDDKAVTVVIEHSLDAIERGALLGPWSDKLIRPVQRRPNARSMEGRIVAEPITFLSQLGEQHTVFVDRGARDGVEEGNTFQVVRSGDPYGRPVDQILHDPSLPTETVGLLVVVDVRETTSLAVVMRSLTELALGDRVEMRAAGN